MKITESLATATQKLQQELDRTNAATRADADLSAAGKRKALADDYTRLMDDMERLRTTAEGTAERTVKLTVREAFGAGVADGASAISARDADDRASRLESSDEALNLLARADMNGDEVLARAIAMRAYNEYVNDPFQGRKWAEVVNTFAEDRPNIEKKIETLEEQRKSQSNWLQAGVTFWLPKPSELTGLSTEQIRALARG